MIGVLWITIPFVNLKSVTSARREGAILTIKNEDCLKQLIRTDDCIFDAMVTDPPAGIAFMNKEWDEDKGSKDEWIKWLKRIMSECYRTMKPGAHGLVWALPRTSHWTGTALEGAGFEIRDVITHLFGSGFPKSLDISKAIDKEAGATRAEIGEKMRSDGKPAGKIKSMSGNAYSSNSENEGSVVCETAPSTDQAKQWDGWGTALKPAAEFWFLIRKPLYEKTASKNVLEWGVGGINIDACRVGTDDNLNGGAYCSGGKQKRENYSGSDTNADASLTRLKKGIGKFSQPKGRFPANLILDDIAGEMLDEQSGFLVGAASRVFSGAKPSKRERGEGNTHPTIKAQKLMRYLCKMVTPPGGTVLDPFMGSGSTGLACKSEGFSFYGIEKNEEYFEIAKKRLGIEC